MDDQFITRQELEDQYQVELPSVLKMHVNSMLKRARNKEEHYTRILLDGYDLTSDQEEHMLQELESYGYECQIEHEKGDSFDAHYLKIFL